ncbi:unnamed protein product [Prorocentrum cordatum]|uniref:Uncharacterized protein n=1 Tax=Prorocentrum cordatum TaxID=2364126 RepID=A0ABN9T0Z2_9DINO|nr:unnamed protein product [Polarella glacialis]
MWGVGIFTCMLACFHGSQAVEEARRLGEVAAALRAGPPAAGAPELAGRLEEVAGLLRSDVEDMSLAWRSLRDHPMTVLLARAAALGTPPSEGRSAACTALRSGSSGTTSGRRTLS